MKEIEEKYDILGQPLSEGCFVASARGSRLLICKICKITKVMIHLVEQKASGYKETFMAYPNTVIRLDGPDALAYILKL